MPDAQTKTVFFYEANSASSPVGWTETFYLPQPFTFDQAIAKAKTYMQSRHSLLGNGAAAVAVRVSNIPPNRLSQIYFFQGKEGMPDLFTSAPGDDFDPTQVALNIRAQDAAGDKRVYWLDGLPDSVTHTLVAQGIDGAYINSPIFKQTLQAIQTVGYGLRVVVKPKAAPPVYNFQPITTMQPIMVRNRKRGRPFFLFRGRRLA
jgi:hypothetical protein